MGALFVLVVLFLPNGLASLGEKVAEKVGQLRRGPREAPAQGSQAASGKSLRNTKLVEGQ
jgi:hypothetical protein